VAWQPTFPRRYLADLSTELRYRLNDWHDLSSVADAGGINASATTITVPAGEELQFKVDGEGLIEVASTSPALPETMRVRAINETLHTISVARGWLGSTAVAHAQNAQIKIFDEFADLVLKTASTRPSRRSGPTGIESSKSPPARPRRQSGSIL